MTAQEIKQDIADLKLAIKSPATPDDKKKLFEDKVEELEAKLKTMEKPKSSEKKDDDDFYKAVKKTSKTVKVAPPPSKSSLRDYDKMEQYAKDYIRYDVMAGKTLAQIRDTKKDYKGKDYSAEIFWSDNTEKFPTVSIKLSNGQKRNFELDELIKDLKAEKPKSEVKKPEVKADEKKEAPDRKKSVPLKKSEVKDLEYDCDELIEKEKKRKAKAKERAKQPKKSEATKIKDRLGEIGDRIEDGAEEGELTKPELMKLIAECKSLLSMLQNKLAKMK